MRMGFVTYTTANGLAHDYIWTVCIDRKERLWCATEGGVSCFDGKAFVTYTTEDGLVSNYIRDICEDHSGRLWFVTGDLSGAFGGGVSCFDGERFITYTTEDGLGGDSFWSIYEDRQERLWFGTWAGGVSMFDGERFVTYTTEDGLLANLVTDILQDREGGLWFAHHQAGLTYYDPDTVQVLTKTPVHTFLFRDSQGGIWSHDTEASICRFDEPHYRRIFNATVRCVAEDSKGALWVGTLGDGLYCYDSLVALQHDDGKRYTQADGLGSNRVYSVFETRDGTIWAGTLGSPGCLCRFTGAPASGGKAFEAIPTPHTVIRLLFEDSLGRLWMGGFGDGGLSCYDPRAKYLRNYTLADGFPSDQAMSIVEDDDGHLWIGTFGELCRFDGEKFITYGKHHGLTNFVHQCSAKDAKGHLWFGSWSSGIYRYSGRHFQRLTTADGLPSNSIRGLLPQSDGSMVIGTNRGIVYYRPTATVPPRIELREVVADKVYQNPTELELTTVGADLLVISYHSLSFATRQMRYSYILEGYDKGWQDTWENQVRYENLPEGQYTFKVIAINRDLVESETPAQLSLTIVPDPRDLEIATLRTEVAHLRREASGKYDFSNLIGRSAAIKEVFALMEDAVDSDLTVLITGETGTGKELVAKAIHYNSPRKDKPLLARNCGAFPKDLIARELFGHCKGAFTGAYEDKEGLFEAASGGTVILDEIGEMPEEAQVNLLRILQEREVQRLGEFELRDVDVRVIAITNRDLEGEMKAGSFREDLYFRLSVFPIHLPPLRE